MFRRGIKVLGLKVSCSPKPIADFSSSLGKVECFISFPVKHISNKILVMLLVNKGYLINT